MGSQKAGIVPKFEVCTHEPLQAPDCDGLFIVQCDASDHGMGAVHCQRDEAGAEHPSVYIRCKLTVQEEAYSVSEKECACLVWAAQKLSWYLSGT